MDNEGGSLSSIIAAFGKSDEFNQRYGGLTYTALVTKIYRQALGRDPDPAGLSWYVGETNGGTSYVTDDNFGRIERRHGCTRFDSGRK